MTNKLNILFTSAGRRVRLLTSFKESLQELGLENVVVAADLKPNAPALHVADQSALLPRVGAADYVPKVLEICERFDIDMVIPLIDPELAVLAGERDAFAERGVTVLVSSPETTAICSDKRSTQNFFERAGFDAPRMLDFDSVLADSNAPYPLLLKPAHGSSSVGVNKIHNRDELVFFRGYVDDAVLQEFVAGDEYTVDVLVDFNGDVLSVVPRLRIETRAGEVSKGMTVKNRAIMSAAQRVVEALPGAIGCQTVQCFRTADAAIRFIEINPRFGGGYPLSYAAGANFSRALCQLRLGLDPDIALDEWRDGLVMLRFDDAVFVDRATLE